LSRIIEMLLTRGAYPVGQRNGSQIKQSSSTWSWGNCGMTTGLVGPCMKPWRIPALSGTDPEDSLGIGG